MYIYILYIYQWRAVVFKMRRQFMYIYQWRAVVFK